MSYYSTINAFGFASGLSPVDLQRTWRGFIEALGEDAAFYMEVYKFDLVYKGEDGLYHYELSMDCYYGRHYNDEDLARFVSEVIAPGDYAKIIFDGEDGERWGYLVIPGEVHRMSFQIVVEGKPLDEFLKSKHIG